MIFLSLTAALLSFRLMRDAADATEPVRRLLVSLIRDSSLISEGWLEADDLTFAVRYFDILIKFLN